jgi:hypothetical protein
MKVFQLIYKYLYVSIIFIYNIESLSKSNLKYESKGQNFFLSNNSINNGKNKVLLNLNDEQIYLYSRIKQAKFINNPYQHLKPNQSEFKIKIKLTISI